MILPQQLLKTTKRKLRINTQMWGVKEREKLWLNCVFCKYTISMEWCVCLCVKEKNEKICVFFGWYEKFECYKNEEVNKNKRMKFRWTKENSSQVI